MNAPQPWTPPERFYTPQQASIRSGVGVKTLAAYAGEGLIGCVRQGNGRRLYPESAVDAARGLRGKRSQGASPCPG